MPLNVWTSRRHNHLDAWLGCGRGESVLRVIGPRWYQPSSCTLAGKDTSELNREPNAGAAFATDAGVRVRASQLRRLPWCTQPWVLANGLLSVWPRDLWLPHAKRYAETVRPYRDNTSDGHPIRLDTRSG